MSLKEQGKNKKIALLIDCDNISFRSIERILEELEPFGDIIIKRAYGNWRNESLKNWLTKLMELSIKPIQQIDYTKGKNATDMAIAIDAMKLLYEKNLDAFAIVSSDSDFTPLAMVLQEDGKKVYGFGYEKSPIALQRACSMFINITPFIKEDKPTLVEPKKEKQNHKNVDIKQQIIDVFIELSPENKPVKFEDLSRGLKLNGIDYTKKGFKQLRVFLDSLNIFNLIVNEKNQGFATLKQVRTDYQPILSNINDDVTLMENVKEAFLALSHNGQKVLSSTLYNILGLKHQFKYKDYGFTSLKSFIEQIKFLKLVFVDGQWYVEKV
ncbi:NYN domain-containing protein [archaeon]|nr:NYN domain-containing protein [archaeon]